MTMPEIMLDHNAHALVVFREGRTMIHALALYNPPVRLVKMPRADRRHWTPMLYKGNPYPLARALRRFREAGRELGITKSARVVLRALEKGDA